MARAFPSSGEVLTDHVPSMASDPSRTGLLGAVSPTFLQIDPMVLPAHAVGAIAADCSPPAALRELAWPRQPPRSAAGAGRMSENEAEGVR